VSREKLTVPARVYEALLSVVNALLERAQRCPSWLARVQGGRCPFHTERHRPELSAQHVIARGNENPTKSGILAKIGANFWRPCYQPPEQRNCPLCIAEEVGRRCQLLTIPSSGADKKTYVFSLARAKKSRVLMSHYPQPHSFDLRGHVYRSQLDSRMRVAIHSE